MKDLKTMVEMVKEFHSTYGVYQQQTPGIPSDIKIRDLRESLIREEVQELSFADAKQDIVEVADAITDCLYIIVGTAITYGMGDMLPDLFAEVHRSNMSKLGADGKPMYREDGKVLKGPNFTLPNLKAIIEKYSANV